MANTEAPEARGAVTPLMAAHVVAHHLVGDNNLGIEPAVGTYNLITRIARADAEQREVLREQFPGYVAAVVAAKASGAWGIDWLRDLARSAHAAAEVEADLRPRSPKHRAESVAEHWFRVRAAHHTETGPVSVPAPMSAMRHANSQRVSS